MIKFEVAGRPISLNEIYTGHWSNRSKNKILWGWAIKSGLLKAKVKRETLEGSVEIHFIFHVKRSIDVDNCAGTVKVIIDFLREYGTLKNDSPAYVSKVCIEVLTKQPTEKVEVKII